MKELKVIENELVFVNKTNTDVGLDISCVQKILLFEKAQISTEQNY